VVKRREVRFTAEIELMAKVILLVLIASLTAGFCAMYGFSKGYRNGWADGSTGKVDPLIEKLSKSFPELKKLVQAHKTAEEQKFQQLVEAINSTRLEVIASRAVAVSNYTGLVALWPVAKSTEANLMDLYRDLIKTNRVQ
jgi:hypothetical protein